VVGELSSVDGLPRSATVRAGTACEVMKISGADFRALLHAMPELLEDLYWQQVERVRRLSRQVGEIMGASE
jgi:CRP-like cAMP-binding protein